MSYDENRIEDLKKKLYSPSTKVGEDIRRPLSDKSHSVSPSWNDGLSLRSEEDNEEIAGISKKGSNSRFGLLISLLIVSFIFFAGALTYAYFVLNSNSSVISNNNIDIAIVTPLSVGGGEILPLDITITNNNSGPIVGADLLVAFPRGTRSADDITQDGERFIDTIGRIEAGEVYRQTVRAIIFGEQNDNVNIEVSLQYNSESSSAIFTKRESIDVALSAPPIIATVEAVNEITSGQNVSFELVLESNSDQVLRDVIIVGKYPFGFSLTDASIDPFFNNRVFKVGDIKPRERIEVNINGVMRGQDNEKRYFDFAIGIQDKETPENIAVALGHVGHDVSIARPFLAIDMRLDREDGNVFVRNAETVTSGEITVTNTTSNAIQDVAVELDITGLLLDKFSVSPKEGFYNSNNNTIVWNTQTNEKLITLQPGASETLAFTFRIKSLLESNAITLNPEIQLVVSTRGERAEDSSVQEELKSTAVANILVATTYFAKAESLYGTGPIINSGPVPPKVGVESTYAIRWTITNTANRLDDARMTTKLPIGVEWKGKVWPNQDSVTYNPATREVIWSIGSIDTKSGYGNPSVSAAFQVGLTPSASQADRDVVLVEPAQFVGYDTFAKINVESSLEVVTTNTSDGNDFRSGRVTQ